jgi:hypothetical protein
MQVEVASFGGRGCTAVWTGGHEVASIIQQPGDTEHGPVRVPFPEPSLGDDKDF